jgi:integrase
MKLTETSVKKLRCPSGKSEHWVADDQIQGFGIRCRGDRAVYMLRYSHKNEDRKLVFNAVGSVTLAAARTWARGLQASIGHGGDPAARRAQEAAAEVEKAGDNFAAKIDAFLDWQRDDPKRGRSPSYIAAMRRSLVDHLKPLHKFGVGEITRKKVAEVLDKIAADRPRAAGTTRAHLSSYYAYLMLKGYEGNNPALGTETRNSETRDRVLTPAELKLIWRATDSGSDYDTIVRLIILTAARKTIIGSLRKSEYDPEKKILDIPIETGKSKNKTRFWLALSPQADEILRAVIDRRGDSPYVFGEGEGGFTGWSKAKIALDERIAELNGDKPIDPWVLHDCRKTFNSLGIDMAGIDDRLADICLHHVGEARKGIKRTYNHATYLDQKHEAMAAWGSFVASAVTP